MNFPEMLHIFVIEDGDTCQSMVYVDRVWLTIVCLKAIYIYKSVILLKARVSSEHSVGTEMKQFKFTLLDYPYAFNISELFVVILLFC
jgi:hypothetical protein